MAQLHAFGADMLGAFDHADLAVNAADGAIGAFQGEGVFGPGDASAFRLAANAAAFLHRAAGRADVAGEADRMAAATDVTAEGEPPRCSRPPRRSSTRTPRRHRV